MIEKGWHALSLRRACAWPRPSKTQGVPPRIAQMVRAVWPWLSAMGLGITVLLGAEPVPLPKDSLPANLALDAIPDGLDAKPPVPKDNPLTEAKVRLGRKLFFDPILSANGSVACATCHQPAHGFAGSSRLSVGIQGREGT